MSHRFIVLVADEDAEKVNRWASTTTISVCAGFPVIEDPVQLEGLIDNGNEPTQKTLDAAADALAAYDEDLANMFRQELQGGNVDRAAILRALRQFTRTRKGAVAAFDAVKKGRHAR